MELKFWILILWALCFSTVIAGIIGWQYVKWRRLDKRGQKFGILWDIQLYASVTAWHLVFVELWWAWLMWAYPDSGLGQPAVFINLAYFCLVGIHGFNFVWKIGRPAGKVIRVMTPYAEAIQKKAEALKMTPDEVAGSLVALVNIAKALDGAEVSGTDKTVVKGGKTITFDDLVHAVVNKPGGSDVKTGGPDAKT